MPRYLKSTSQMFSASAPPWRVAARYCVLFRSLCHWSLLNRSTPARVKVNPVLEAADDSCAAERLVQHRDLLADLGVGHVAVAVLVTHHVHVDRDARAAELGGPPPPGWCPWRRALPGALLDRALLRRGDVPVVGRPAGRHRRRGPRRTRRRLEAAALEGGHRLGGGDPRRRGRRPWLRPRRGLRRRARASGGSALFCPRNAGLCPVARSCWHKCRRTVNIPIEENSLRFWHMPRHAAPRDARGRPSQRGSRRSAGTDAAESRAVRRPGRPPTSAAIRVVWPAVNSV